MSMFPKKWQIEFTFYICGYPTKLALRERYRFRWFASMKAHRYMSFMIPPEYAEVVAVEAQDKAEVRVS